MGVGVVLIAGRGVLDDNVDVDVGLGGGVSELEVVVDVNAGLDGGVSELEDIVDELAGASSMLAMIGKESKVNLVVVVSQHPGSGRLVSQQ